jgi:hypothetical protein
MGMHRSLAKQDKFIETLISKNIPVRESSFHGLP